MPDYLAHTWGAYALLSGSRQIGMSSGPIPLSEVKAYCEMFGIDDFDDRADLAEMVSAIDSEFRAFQNEKAEGNK